MTEAEHTIGLAVADQLRDTVNKAGTDKATRIALRRCLSMAARMIDKTCAVAIDEDGGVYYGPTFQREDTINIVIASPDHGTALTLDQWPPIIASATPPAWFNSGNYWCEIIKAVQQDQTAMAATLLAYKLGVEGLAAVDGYRQAGLAVRRTPVVVALTCDDGAAACGLVGVVYLPARLGRKCRGPFRWRPPPQGQAKATGHG
jgi:hypothetical protein